MAKSFLLEVTFNSKISLIRCIHSFYESLISLYLTLTVECNVKVSHVGEGPPPICCPILLILPYNGLPHLPPLPLGAPLYIKVCSLLHLSEPTHHKVASFCTVVCSGVSISSQKITPLIEQPLLENETSPTTPLQGNPALPPENENFLTSP